jgi:hypothetical protein
MGTLKTFIEYLDERIATMSTIEQRLCKLQEKYETFFAEVARVRESELGQLTEHVLADRAKLPAWFNEKLDQAEAEVRKELEGKLAELEGQHEKLLKEAEALRQKSVEEERRIRKKNVELDRQEEELKARNQKLLADIVDYNDRIRQLGRGFGFFANFFKMRRLARERRDLDREQVDVAARIEALRGRWGTEEKEYTAREYDLQRGWIKQETEAAAVRTKLDYLEQAQPRIVLRTTLERVLYELVQEPPVPAESDPPCPRCKTPNPPGGHFCQICARRLGEDRPDFEGSVQEIAEVNLHHRRFSEGMKACQEIIGLVRGLRSGLEAFLKSVKDVKKSQDQHSLSTLSIDVPGASVEYGKSFDGLKRYVEQELSLHPKVFAEQIGGIIKGTFSEAQIKGYFEAMGEELSKRAHAQWG